MRLSAMGDVAMTVPVLRALVSQHPDVKVTVVSRPFFKPFFDNIPNIDFLPFDEKVRHKGLPGLLRLYSDIKKRKIDAFADLHNVLRSQIVRNLLSISGVKVVAVNKGRTDKKALTREHNKVFKPMISMFDRHAEVFKVLGLPIDLSHPQFPEPQLPDAQIGELTGVKQGKWIGIAPFAQYDSKVYPKDLMQMVIDELAQNSGYKILLFGGKAEVAILDVLAAGKNNVLNMAGKIKFRQELQLISNLDLMLSMDSGNAHIAAMLGVKTITLWGATHPFTGFSPFGQPLENAITADRSKYPKIPTSVYGNKVVDGYQDAMRTISPEVVVEKICHLLK